MALSQSEVDKILKDIQDNFDIYFHKGDAETVSSFYHPDGCLIHRGNKASYGRTEIKKAYEEMLKSRPKAELFVDENLQAGGGRYLIQRGTYTMGGSPKFEYEQIYKKGADGKYLIYHDEFEYDPNQKA